MAMSRADMLKQMNITDADFTDYLNQYNTFFNGLNPNQKAFHLRNNKTRLGDIAASLGPTATPDDVQQLFAGAVQPAAAAAQPAGAAVQPAAAAVQPANMMASISCCRN
jgi:hypothetical protein